MAEIPIEHLSKIRRIEIKTNRLVQDLFSGKYKSVFRGRGLYFEEVREFQQGDEVKYIDWNVSARMNDLYVKVFREERELTVILMVDVSGSGDYGSDRLSKREIIAELASVLAYSVICNNDRVGLMLFSDEVEHYVRPRKSRQDVLRIIRDILYFKPKSRGTDIDNALRHLNNLLVKRALIFLISDFLDDGYERLLKITGKRHDLVPILVRDHREIELPSVGCLSLEDAETGEIVEVDTSDSGVRKKFVQERKEHLEAFHRECVRGGMDLMEIHGAGGYIRALMNFFKNRAQRRK